MIRKWALFVLSIILMGLWFPVSFFRKDERWFFADNFGLDTHNGAAPGDSVEEAWAALSEHPFSPHQIKNILHEWTKEGPKRAAKFLSFVILIEAILIGILV